MIKFKQYITEMIHGKTYPEYDLDDSYDEQRVKAEHHESLSKHYTPKLNKYDEQDSIREYTRPGGLFHSINKYLNGKEDNYGYSMVRMAYNIPILHSVTTSHEAPHDFHVYTGIKHDPTEGKEHKEPFKAHIKQFTSSSLSPKVASAFSKLHIGGDKHILKIQIPKGSKYGFYVHDHAATTKQGGKEYEFLLKKNLRLKIHHEPEMIVGRHGTNHKIWHATIED